MVHLKCIDNPFEEKMMIAISKFYEEKSFYDCINRRFLDDQSFRNLEYTFYMYFLIGDTEDKIGYILLSNKDRVNGYFCTAYKETLLLLRNYKTKFGNSGNQKELQRLEKLIIQNRDTDSFRQVIEEVTSSLQKLSVMEFLDSMKSGLNNQGNGNRPNELGKFINQDCTFQEWCTLLEEFIPLLNKPNVPHFQFMYDMFFNYWQQLQQYLDSFPNYFYLDVVIALPKEEKIILQKENNHSNLSIDLLAELKYYGFIQETLARVEEEIRHKFPCIPILLENSDTFFINEDTLSDDTKLLMKQIRESHGNQ